MHQTSLKSYLRKTFPGVQDVDDVVQESFLRIWKVRTQKPIDSAQAFLFKIARHVSLDFLRRKRACPIDAQFEYDEKRAVADVRSAADIASLKEKVDLLTDALAHLSPRQREVLVGCKFQLMKRRDVAAAMRISEATVDEYLGLAIDQVEKYLRARGVDGCFGR